MSHKTEAPAFSLALNQGKLLGRFDERIGIFNEVRVMEEHKVAPHVKSQSPNQFDTILIKFKRLKVIVCRSSESVMSTVLNKKDPMFLFCLEEL
jgi:hypothetical protein